MWPWHRHRREVAATLQDVAVASAEKKAAQERRMTANLQAAKARAVTDRLQREIEKNGWTELLQHAWGGR